MSDLTNTVQGSGGSRPILFSGPMVRALLAGTKTQTRRIIKPRGRVSLFDGSWSDSHVLDPGNQSWRDQEVPVKLGDRLWVRESWDFIPLDEPKPEGAGRAEIIYWADADRREFDVPAGFNPIIYGHERFRPSIHMPRWASRLTLTVTDARVQRLHDISEEDAIAEGVATFAEGRTVRSISDAEIYRLLWEEINGAGSWEANPWVAAYTFTVEHQNIDAALKAVSP